MRYRNLLGCSVLVLAIAAGAPATAQNARRFKVEAKVSALHDDNISRSNALVAQARGIEQEDVIVSPTLSVDIAQPIGRQALFLTGLVGYNFYQENDQLNRERINLRGGAISTLGPCATTLAGGYNRRQSDLELLEVGVTENVETTTSVSIDGACGRQIGIAPTFSAGREWTENSAALRSTADYTSTTALAGLSYRRPTFGDLTLFGSYGKTEYDRLVPSGVGGALEEDGYEIWGGGMRYTRRIGARLQGTVTAGYTSVEPSASNTDDFQGFTYGADITFKPSGRIETQAAFTRSVKPSSREQTSYSVEENYNLQVRYAIGSRIKLGLGASYADNQYEGVSAGSGLLLTEEQIKSIFASLRLNVSDRLAVMLDATQQERDANVPGFDYTSNRVGLSIVASY